MCRSGYLPMILLTCMNYGYNYINYGILTPNGLSGGCVFLLIAGNKEGTYWGTVRSSACSRLLTTVEAASVCLAVGLEESGARLLGMSYTSCCGSVNACGGNLPTIFYSKRYLLFFFNLKDLIYINFKLIKNRIGWI